LCLIPQSGLGNQSVAKSVNTTLIELYTYDEK
jgi:hypothetical protein